MDTKLANDILKSGILDKACEKVRQSLFIKFEDEKETDLFAIKAQVLAINKINKSLTQELTKIATKDLVK